MTNADIRELAAAVINTDDAARNCVDAWNAWAAEERLARDKAARRDKHKDES